MKLEFNVDPIRLLGLFLILFSSLIISIDFIDRLRCRIKTRGDILNKKIKFYSKIDTIISKVKILNKIKERLQLKYGVINSSTENKNKITAIKTIFYITIATAIVVLILAFIIKIWYLYILISVSIAVFPYIILFAVLDLKLSKLSKQFPEAVNIFITKYTSEKNKDKALQRTYIELENPIRYEFMRLARMMANKGNIFEAVHGFTKRVNYIWAEVFGELLVLNHTTVEDIGDELNELSLLMAEDQTLEAHKKAEITETKSVNIIVSLLVFAAIIFNITVFKSEAINIYFERYIGLVSISIGIVVVIICLILTFYFERD